MLTPAQMQALNQQAVIGDPRDGGILGASSSPFAQSLGDRSALAAAIAQAEASGQLTEMTQIPVSPGPQTSMTLGGGPAPLSQAIDPNVLAALTAQLQARNAQFGTGPVAQAPQSNPTGAPQPVPQPIQQMQPISAPQSLGGQMGGGMTGPQFPGQGGGQGGIGSLLQPIQARMIQQFNQQKVMPLLNNFERNAQATITGGQGMQQGAGYSGVMQNNPFQVR